jgi:hypothetical protein
MDKYDFLKKLGIPGDQVEKWRQLADNVRHIPAAPSAALRMAAGPTAHVTHVEMEKVPLDPEKEPVRKDARKNFVHARNEFFTLWMTAATDALAGATDPDEPESHAGWVLALAGNLLWAGTCFLPGANIVAGVLVVSTAVKVATPLMAFGGVMLAAGANPPPDDKAPSGKEMVGAAISLAHDKLQRNAAPILESSVIQCGDQNITDEEDQQKFFWSKLFSTPFMDAGPIRAQMSTNINAALKSYNDQWHKWKEEVLSMVSGDVLDFMHEIEEAKKEHPFKPKLNFV